MSETSDPKIIEKEKKRKKPVFSLNDMVTHVRRNDLARANRFACYINGPLGIDANEREASMMVEEVSIPGLNLTYNPVKIGPWTENRVSNVEFYGDTAAITFFADTEWNSRQYFESWMKEIVNPVSKEVKFYGDYTGQITVYSLNRQDEIIGEWTLHEAFPRVLSLTPLGHAAGEGVARMTVTFSFLKWTPGKKGDRRSLLGKFLNLRFGTLEGQLKNSVKNTINDLIDDTIDTIF